MEEYPAGHEASGNLLNYSIYCYTYSCTCPDTYRYLGWYSYFIYYRDYYKTMKQDIIDALGSHFAAHINKHIVNVKIMLENPMAIHDHSDLLGAIELELAQIAEYEDKLDALELVKAAL